MSKKLNVITYHYVRDVKKKSYHNLKAQNINTFKKKLKYFKKKNNIISTIKILDVISGRINLKKIHVY